MEFSEDIVQLLKDRFPGKDIYKMSLQELKTFKVLVNDLRHEYSLLELANKLLGNGAYGSCASDKFYFFNVALASDITAECRNLTQTMWNKLEEFFHKTIWERKDLWEQFDFALDESKHEWYNEQPISVYSDTDSVAKETMLRVIHNNVEVLENIETLCDNILKENGVDIITKNGQEIIKCDNLKVLNYTDKDKLCYKPVKYIMRHKVNKPKYVIKTKSGKQITVTGDHSCVVFRDGKQITIKAKDINIKTDKILSVTDNISYKFENIYNITIEDNFEDEYVYDIEVDDESHTFIGNDILVHNSVYTTYGTLFECFTDEYKKKYDTDDKRLAWILKFNKEFIDKQNNQWCEEMYNPRHGNSIHEFELETVSKACIYLKKKKYLKGLIFSKGKYFDHPKMMGAGIEIVKSTTPKLCRDILLDMTKSLMFESGNYSKTEYFMYFQNKLEQWRRKFYTAPIEDISQSVGIGDYKKFVIEDEKDLILEKGCPVSVKGIARYNYLAFKNDEKWKRTYSGKIKYYNISLGPNNSTFFGYPAGELPEWAPKMDKTIQWKKTVIEPINRFIEVMGAEGYNPDNTYQLSLF